MAKCMRLALLVWLVAGILLLPAACRGDKYSTVRDELARNQQRWASQKVADYKYQLKIICFCPPDLTMPVIIEVRNGDPVSFVDAETGMPREPKYFDRSDSVDRLFGIIDDAISRRADDISVTYDSTYGYPNRIRIDYLKNAIDDEITYEVSRFEVLTGK